ncbi:MAG: hypothetical protein AAF512_26095, partial [Pseudomonadota bacterium]
RSGGSYNTTATNQGVETCNIASGINQALINAKNQITWERDEGIEICVKLKNRNYAVAIACFLKRFIINSSPA